MIRELRTPQVAYPFWLRARLAAAVAPEFVGGEARVDCNRFDTERVKGSTEN